jgi:hypothetical protein
MQWPVLFLNRSDCTWHGKFLRAIVTPDKNRERTDPSTMPTRCHWAIGEVLASADSRSGAGVSAEGLPAEPARRQRYRVHPAAQFHHLALLAAPSSAATGVEDDARERVHHRYTKGGCFPMTVPGERRMAEALFVDW